MIAVGFAMFVVAAGFAMLVVALVLSGSRKDQSTRDPLGIEVLGLGGLFLMLIGVTVFFWRVLP